MGRGNKRRKSGKGGNAKNAKRDDRDDPNNRRNKGGENRVIEHTNAQFEEYYKAQSFIPEGEFEAFLDHCKKPLPVSWRITGTRKHAECLREILEDTIFPRLEGVVVDDVVVPAPVKLDWYTDSYAYHLDIARTKMRRDPGLQALQKFLVNEAEKGTISRQETVSMIPPLILDVQPGHKVLDLCAAPGSKTCQIIEHLDSFYHDPKKINDGLVVANDIDNKRCYLLVHQTKRLRSPRILVVNQDASTFPKFYLENDKGEKNSKALKFDRILADVPCSGDGTIRKNVKVWVDWTPYPGYALHDLQIRILSRGINMLHEDGLLCYSTCSFLAAENEAVIAHVLNLFKGAVELVDISDKLPNLKRVNGVTSWSNYGEVDGEWKFFNKYEEVPESLRKKIKPTMFPCENINELNIDRCMRMLPNHQNTGGFFICALRKVKDLEVEIVDDQNEGGVEKEEKAEVKETEKTEREIARQKKKDMRPGSRGFQESPFFFCDGKEELIQRIVERYGVDSSFPLHNLCLRHETTPRSVYVVTDSVRQAISHNQSSMNVINSGVKIFNKCDLTKDETSGFRVCQEGLALLAPFLNKRVVKLNFNDVVTLIAKKNLAIAELSEPCQKVLFESNGGSLCGIFDPKCSDSNSEDNGCLSTEKTYISLWAGKTFVKVMMDAGEIMSTLMLLVGPVKAEEAIQRMTQEDHELKAKNKLLKEENEVALEEEHENMKKEVTTELKSEPVPEPMATEEVSTEMVAEVQTNEQS